MNKRHLRHMNVIPVDKNKAGLNASAATFARSTFVELIGRRYLNVFTKSVLFL